MVEKKEMKKNGKASLKSDLSIGGLSWCSIRNISLCYTFSQNCNVTVSGVSKICHKGLKTGLNKSVSTSNSQGIIV